MAVRNAHFYNRNEGQAYPLDDTATLLSVTGTVLPSNILCDMNLRWPRHLGAYAFISSISVTTSLVTLTIQAAGSLDGEDFAPLAVLSVVKPISEGRMYALLAQAGGVGGWVVFGSGANDSVPRALRFASPRAGLLAPRTARPYNAPPVRSLGVLGLSTALTGVITLRAEPPLSIKREERTIDGVNRDCIVVRLVDGAGEDGFPVPAQITGFKEESIFKQFAGPCAGRPESSNCGVPHPVEFVNAVSPDCNGVITIEFRGCAIVTHVLEPCGVAVDCELGLVDACFPPQIPDSEGLLPGEYPPVNLPPYVPPLPPEPEPGLSESVIDVTVLPFVDCFVHGGLDFVTKMGLWQTVPDDSPELICPEDGYTTSESVSVSGSVSYSDSVSVGFSPGYYESFPVRHMIQAAYQASTAAARNVAVWEGDVQAVYRKVSTDVKLIEGPVGAKHNAGLVLNYRPHQTVGGQFVYYVVEVDWDSQQFKVSRFNGVNFQTVVPVMLPAIALDVWYRITAEVLPGPPGQTVINATLETVGGGTSTSVSVTVSSYQPSTGSFGMTTNRALARFAYFKVEEAYI